MKKACCLVIVLCCLLFTPLGAQDNAPKKERQIVFGVSPFDGTRYLSSFLPENRKDMHMVANSDNAVTVLLSDVYYWPITAEYLADFQGIHIPLDGKLSIFRGKELIQELKPIEYLYKYPRGPTGEATELLQGEKMEHFMRDVTESLPERAANPNKAWPSFQGPFRGFVLNLPPGNYRIVFSAENQGQIFSMEKRLRVFPPQDRGMVYQFIPHEKWTVSSNSETPHQRIYLRPGSIIYLKTFPALLYSQADYDLMVAPHRPAAGIGLSNFSTWIQEDVSLEETGNTSLYMEAAGQSAVVHPHEFLIRQLEGSALGYTILDYDPEKFLDTRPTFSAYRLFAPPPGIGVRLTISGRGDESVRYMRTLEPRALYMPLLALLLPFILLGFRFTLDIIERRRYRRVDKRFYSANSS